MNHNLLKLLSDMIFSEAVECYRCLLCKGHLDELDRIQDAYSAWCREPNSKNLHNLARVCVIGGHQRRTPQEAKNRAISTLEEHLPTLLRTQFEDFEALYDRVKFLIGNFPRIGLLAVYDVALRIGHLFDSPIYPIKYLYLNHNGAMKGATKLLAGRKLLWRELFNDFFSYPEAQKVVGIEVLQALPNCLVEDFLCVMEQYLDCGPRGLIADRWKTDTYQRIKAHS